MSHFAIPFCLLLLLLFDLFTLLSILGCGPQELNTLVRHLVSDRIDLRKVFEGDPTGDIALILEDFSF